VSQLNHSRISHNHQDRAGSRRLSTVLQEAGAGFVLIPPRSKAPTYKGWQRNPKPLAEAFQHAANGGNVGLLGGHNGLILLDADAHADKVLAAEPRLSRTVRIFRRNAPDRAKWIVRIAGELPPSKKAHGIIEVLATGTQGVIVGVHDSGAAIEYDGDTIITLTATDVAALWRTLTGEELGRTRRRDDAPPPDAEAVQRSMGLVATVLEAGTIKADAWQPYDNGGRLAELTHCPFVERTAEPNRQHGAEGKAFVIVHADGRIGAGCHSARCQHAIAAHGGSGWALLKEIAGYKPHTDDMAHARLLVEQLRGWVRRTDLAEQVPIVKQSDTGYRTRDTDTAVADAILDIAHERGRLERLPLSLRDLRARAGLGSANTAACALDRLLGWYVVKHPVSERKAWEAELYDLNPAIVAAAEDALQLAYIARSSATDTRFLDQANQRAIYATAPLVTHRQHDAFTASMTPITEEELQARIDARKARIEAGEDVRPIERSRYRRRLAAILPSAGRGVLRMIDALATEGSSTKAKLIDLLNVSPSSLSRLVSRAVDLGLVEADRHTVTLAGDWAETLEVITPHMPTANRSHERADKEDAEAIRWAQQALKQPDITPEEEKRRRRTIARRARRRKERAAQLRPDLTVGHADVAAPSVRDRLAMIRLAERTAQARIEQAEERHGNQWRLTAEIGRLRREKLAKREAWRILEMAGWERREVATAMVTAWPSAGQEVAA